jgi:peptidoglycan/xylan/chitin deacetylase (PgdA/CDA1 family)
VWLTFDDGWKKNVTNVVPVAVEHDIPVTIFISTGPIEGNGVFWWTYAEKLSNDLPLTYKNDINMLWKIPESERKKILDDLISKHINDIPREAMTNEDVKEIAKIPQVTIGSHTVNHVITPNCTIEELDKEIGESKAKLEQWAGKKITCFTYPNGDLDGKEIDILKKYNFTLAATAENRLINPDDDIFRLPRFSISDGSFPEEICHMTGIWKPIILKIKSKLH